jgi:hypothetical protein
MDWCIRRRQEVEGKCLLSDFDMTSPAGERLQVGVKVGFRSKLGLNVDEQKRDVRLLDDLFGELNTRKRFAATGRPHESNVGGSPLGVEDEVEWFGARECFADWAEFEANFAFLAGAGRVGNSGQPGPFGEVVCESSYQFDVVVFAMFKLVSYETEPSRPVRFDDSAEVIYSGFWIHLAVEDKRGDPDIKIFAKENLS